MTGKTTGGKLNGWGNSSGPLGFPEVERRGTSPLAVWKSTISRWRLHCSVRPAVSLITHCRGGPAWGRVRQYGAWETPCCSPKNEALIKLHTTTSQHLAPSTQLDYTQVKAATHTAYGWGREGVCVWPPSKNLNLNSPYWPDLLHTQLLPLSSSIQTNGGWVLTSLLLATSNSNSSCSLGAKHYSFPSPLSPPNTFEQTNFHIQRVSLKGIVWHEGTCVKKIIKQWFIIFVD